MMRRGRMLFALLLSLVLLIAVPPAVGQDDDGPGGGTPGTSLNFEVVGHDPLLGRGFNAALALFGDHVYVGNRTDGSSRCGNGDPRGDTDPDSCPHTNPGVLVVDASDPADPSVVNEIGPPYAGNVSETTRELRVWDRKELLIVLSFGCSSVIHSCVPGGVTPTLRFFDLSDPADPAFISEWVPQQANGAVRTPHEFYLWQDPKDPDRALLWMSTPTSSSNADNANLLIADISDVADGADPVLIAQGTWNDQMPGIGNRALHSMTPNADGEVTHLAYLSAYYLALDTSEVAEGNPPEGTVIDLNDALLTPVENRPDWGNPNPGHSAVPIPGRERWVLNTDEVYGTFTNPAYGCPWGWAHMIRLDPAHRRVDVADEYLLPENSCPPPSEADQARTSYASHNPTLTRNLALVTWHSGGLQAIDIAHPRQMQQTGWFSPQPLEEVANEDPALSMGDNKVVMWSYPIIKDGLIYVVDLRNGLYILEYTGDRSHEVSRLTFLEGNSNLGDALRLARIRPG